MRSFSTAGLAVHRAVHVLPGGDGSLRQQQEVSEKKTKAEGGASLARSLPRSHRPSFGAALPGALFSPSRVDSSAWCGVVCRDVVGRRSQTCTWKIEQEGGGLGWARLG